jgi:hypothetical protein
MDFQNPFMTGDLGGPSAAATASMAPPPVPGSGSMGPFALPEGPTPLPGWLLADVQPAVLEYTQYGEYSQWWILG